uniref:Putative spermidine/putrescine transport system substrate-binding protein n=1 Tax=Candidatus Kentrum sp. FW TaxID=2126338 RepID=A0A450SEH4_9GAMM|nr:MAG: putative spermidine/putrescine transport system substrate-binding protein [Candidatus Kentron sp. FW]
MTKSKITYLAVLIAVFVGVGVWMTSDQESTEGKQGRQELVVLSYGGAFAKAQRAAYFEPFEKETGIRIVDASYGGEYGKLKAAVESAKSTGNTVPWDVIDLEASALIRGKRDDILTSIPSGKVDTAELIPEAVDTHGIGTDFYSVSLGWNTGAFPSSGPQPTSWKDFWDVGRFPGPRTMKKDPRFTLEIALLADGVLPDQVYMNGSLDVDRAFKSLEKIKPHISVWWSSGQQPIQLLSDGEVVMAAAFGARLNNAQYKDKKPVAMTWKGGILDIEYWAVPKYARNPEAAFEFIDFASRADRQAQFPEFIPLGPANKKAFEIMPEALAKNLNTYPTTFKTQVVLSAEYWADNEKEVLERFNRWLGQ